MENVVAKSPSLFLKSQCQMHYLKETQQEQLLEFFFHFRFNLQNLKTSTLWYHSWKGL